METNEQKLAVRAKKYDSNSNRELMKKEQSTPMKKVQQKSTRYGNYECDRDTAEAALQMRWTY